MPGFKVRRATVKDIPLLSEHRNKMFEEYEPLSEEERKAAVEAYPGWAREMMKQRLFHGYLVETVGGSVAGSGCVWLRQVQPSRGRPAALVPYLMSIYTEPKFRRKGVASIIVNEAMSWGKKKGFRRMTLHASPVGRKVYSQLGWKRIWEMEVRLDRPPATRLRAKASRRASSPSRASRKHQPRERPRRAPG